MSTGTLHWYADRGFELDVDASEEDVAIRLQAVPIPADGTAELRSGVDLDRLDVLFKASVKIQGETAQLHEARVQLVSEDGHDLLEIDARCEELETGDIVPLRLSVPIALPAGAPERGGPRPVPTNEDELDWEDETTLEQLVVNAPDIPLEDALEDEEPPSARRGGGAGARLGAAPEKPARGGKSGKATDKPAATGKASGKTAGKGVTGSGGKAAAQQQASEKGFQALLKALARLDDDDEEPAKPAKPSKPATAAPPEEDDQLLGAEGEAKSLLDILVEGDHLELEGDAELDGLVPGVAKILGLPLPPEAKATRLSSWLLEQEEVADLFISDEDLAEILERW